MSIRNRVVVLVLSPHLVSAQYYEDELMAFDKILACALMLTRSRLGLWHAIIRQFTELRMRISFLVSVIFVKHSSSIFGLLTLS